MLTVIAAVLAVVTLFLWIGVWYVVKTFPVAPPMAPFPIRPTYARHPMVTELIQVPKFSYCASATYSPGFLWPVADPRRVIETQMFFGTVDG